LPGHSTGPVYASAGRCWDAQVIPGLLQTPDYARAVFRGGEPDLSDAEISRRVDLRIARQEEVLGGGRLPLVWSVLSEGALRLRVGGTKVMQAQLEHLITLSERPTVEVQVLRAAAGAHTGPEGTFTILSFPVELEHDPGCVYAETLIKGIYYEEPEQVMKYRNALAYLRDKAESTGNSPEVIHHIAKEL
jgi:hypothetical protein